MKTPSANTSNSAPDYLKNKNLKLVWFNIPNKIPKIKNLE